MTDKPTYDDWKPLADKEVKGRDLTWHTPDAPSAAQPQGARQEARGGSRARYWRHVWNARPRWDAQGVDREAGALRRIDLVKELKMSAFNSLPVRTRFLPQPQIWPGPRVAVFRGEHTV